MKSRLATARLYLVAPTRLAAGTLAELVPELAAAGLDLVQLREKEMEGGDIVREGAPIGDACRAAGIPFIVNDRPDVALAVDADGVHLGQNDIPLAAARSILGTDAIVGLSTHATSEIDSAVRGEGTDYLSVGPVQETPTKPGRPGTSLDLVRYAARAVGMPWFVTGGMAPGTLPAAMEAGARRIVVVRAITEAPDPVATASRLREMLEVVPL